MDVEGKRVVLVSSRAAEWDTDTEINALLALETRLQKRVWRTEKILEKTEWKAVGEKDGVEEGFEVVEREGKGKGLE